MNYYEDSSGIYNRGHGGYNETMSAWKKQREGIHDRLVVFGKNIYILKSLFDIIEEAKKNNKNGLPF